MSWQGYAAAGHGYGYSYSAASSSTTMTNKHGQQAPARQDTREQHVAKIETWRCTICNKDFGSKSGVNRHFTMVHEQPKPKAVAPKAVVPASSPSIACLICGKIFASQATLNRHVNTMHNGPGPMHLPGSGPVHRPGPKPGPGARNTAVSQSTKVVQKNKTNTTINIYNPVIYKNK